MAGQVGAIRGYSRSDHTLSVSCMEPRLQVLKAKLSKIVTARRPHLIHWQYLSTLCTLLSFIHGEDELVAPHLYPIYRVEVNLLQRTDHARQPGATGAGAKGGAWLALGIR
jgi:hypothetical protein